MPFNFWSRLRMTLDMIKFEHSVFALPFALTAAMLAVRDGAAGGSLSWKLFWIIAAMVGARSAAMAFNRVLDAEIDARNPRTSSRHLPAGLLSRRFTWGFIAVSAAVFAVSAAALNPLCLKLAPAALAWIFFYSSAKRFTSFSHVILGLSLGIAPAAAWIAMTGALDLRILWLTGAVTLWTAGFDIIYACQDYDFDCRENLHSLPKRLGIGGALWAARFFHLAMVACLAMLAQQFRLGSLSAAGIALVAALLVYEHWLVKPHDLSKVNAAFFTVNGYVSVAFFVFWVADMFVISRGGA
jgi:4-hydroxybenzoate polyprenyltransferase